jgi:hypothetical protein
MPSQTSGWQREPVHRSLATIDQLAQLVDIHKALQARNVSKRHWLKTFQKNKNHR